MAYRDDLEAAQQQIQSLETRLRQNAAAAVRRQAFLEGQVRDLKRQLGRMRELPPVRLWVICWLPSVVVLGLQGLAIFWAMMDQDGSAWAAAQLAILAGVLGTAWSWGARGLMWPWALLLALKAAIIVGWGWGWWYPFYKQLAHPGTGTPLYFFWCAPFVVLAVVLVEGMLIRTGLRPAGVEESVESASGVGGGEERP
jgi:hypothetical protein